MPERGEVYLMTRRLRKRMPIGTIITKIRAYDDDLPCPVPKEHFPLKITKISSRSKKTYMEFENGYGMLISYGMTASWKVKPPEFVKYKFYVESATAGVSSMKVTRYYWQCIRKLHCETVEYMRLKKLHKKLDDLGLDIYYDEPDEKIIIANYPPRGKNVCAFLLDGTFGGIGNYLKSMIIYRTGISPHRNTKDLSDKEKVAIWNTAKDIVKEVIGMGGHCVQDFELDDDKKLGEYDTTPYLPKLWKNKNMRTPRDAKGNKIVREYLGGRVTYWCPELQK